MVMQEIQVEIQVDEREKNVEIQTRAEKACTWPKKSAMGQHETYSTSRERQTMVSALMARGPCTLTPRDDQVGSVGSID